MGWTQVVYFWAPRVVSGGGQLDSIPPSSCIYWLCVLTQAP